MNIEEFAKTYKDKMSWICNNDDSFWLNTYNITKYKIYDIVGTRRHGYNSLYFYIINDKSKKIRVVQKSTTYEVIDNKIHGFIADYVFIDPSKTRLEKLNLI